LNQSSFRLTPFPPIASIYFDVHRNELEQAGATEELLESTAYWPYFPRENEALSPNNTIPSQKFAATAKSYLVRLQRFSGAGEGVDGKLRRPMA